MVALPRVAVCLSALLVACSGEREPEEQDSYGNGQSGLGGAGAPGSGGFSHVGGALASGGEVATGAGGVASGNGGLSSAGGFSSTGGASSAGGSATGGLGSSAGAANTGAGGSATDVVLTGVETPDPGCNVAPPPAYSALRENGPLPDPFTLEDGTRVLTRGDWACRRAEILEHAAEYELGPKPPKPSSVTGSMNGSTLSIEVSEGGSSIQFTVSVSKPSGSGPFPAIIAYAFPSIPVPREVATITFSNDTIAAQRNTSSRGQGKFYELYGRDHGAGALMAWAWGVSRIIDALEATPAAGIDPTRIGVTGCSRNGKGALVAGAYDARIALTIPQESGSGGSACWRVSDDQKSRGQNVQTASQIVTENVWFRTSFSQFGNAADRLTFDHHMLAGLVAPRGLLIIENTAMEWLGNVSCFTCSVAAHRIWEALGAADNMGFSQLSHGDHCVFPREQEPELSAYIGRFLLGQEGDTEVMKTDGGFTFDESRWVDWETPEIQ